MAFVLTLDDNTELTFIKGNDELICRFPIGYDDEIEKVYSVFVALAPVMGQPDVYELVFHVIEAAVDGDDDPVAFWDGLETKSIIPDRGERRSIMIGTCCAIEALLDKKHPKAVTFMTHHANLPDKALEKYGFVCQTIGRKGYFCAPADSYHGRHIWMAERT